MPDGLTCRRYFLPVGFLVVDEAWGCMWPGLVGVEAGLLAGVVGLEAPFHWSMALFLNAPPAAGGRVQDGRRWPSGKSPTERVTFSLPYERRAARTTVRATAAGDEAPDSARAARTSGHSRRLARMALTRRGSVGCENGGVLGLPSRRPGEHAQGAPDRGRTRHTHASQAALTWAKREACF
jgi:hypothetical protein